MDRLRKLLDMLEEDPNSDFLLFAVAKEYEKIGNIAKSEEYYLRLKAHHPYYVGLYYHLAELYKQKNSLDKAEEIYLEGIKISEEIKDLHSLSELKTAYANLFIE